MDPGHCEREEVPSAAEVDAYDSRGSADGIQGAAGSEERQAQGNSSGPGDERQAQGNLLASRAPDADAEAAPESRGGAGQPSAGSSGQASPGSAKAAASGGAGPDARGEAGRGGGKKGKARGLQGSRKAGQPASPGEKRAVGALWSGLPQQQRREAEALLGEADAIVDDAEMAPEDKVQQLHASIKRQAEWVASLQRDVVVLQHRLVEVQHDKDAEIGKGATLRSKLEALCRELQAQNKAMKAEGQVQAEAERQKREELSNHFLSSIKDIESRLGEQGDAQVKAIEENARLLEQMRKASLQAQLREKEWEYEAKKFAMEQRISELQVQQQVQVAIKERTEKEEVLQRLVREQKERSLLHDSIADYGKRFQECQEMLAKSNEVMQSFKEDRKKMLKKVSRMEEDMTALRVKGSKSDASLIELAEERNALQKQLHSVSQQKAKLESLCRSLHERNKPTAAPPIALPADLDEDGTVD